MTANMIRTIGIKMCYARNRKLTCPVYRMSSSQVTSNSSHQSEIRMGERSEAQPHRPGTKQIKLKSAEVILKHEPNHILFEEHGECGLISINRADTMNSLTVPMFREILAKLKEWEKRKGLVVIEGLGDKAFCAGGDLTMVLSLIPEELPSVVDVFFQSAYRLGHAVNKYKIPFIALMNNITMGSATSISLTGKYRVVTEKSVYGMPEVQIGFYPEAASSYFFTRLPNFIGYYLGLTGSTLKGIDLRLLGIGTHYVPSERLPDLKKDLLASKAEDIEVILHKYQPKDILRNEFSLAPHLDKITKCFSAPTVEEIISRLENDGSQWAKKTTEKLHQACPLSLKLTHQVFQKGEKLNLIDCYKMNYKVSIQSVTADSNFVEGIRVKLIDKTSKPVWKPKHLKDVTEEEVTKFFHEPKELQLDISIRVKLIDKTSKPVWKPKHLKDVTEEEVTKFFHGSKELQLDISA